MDVGIMERMEEIYPRCRSCLEAGKWSQMIEAMQADEGPGVFADLLSSRIAAEALPPFLPDLARLEWAIYKAKKKACSFQPEDHPTVNPSLELVGLAWRNLPAFMTSGRAAEQGHEYVLVFKHPNTGEAIAGAASEEDLLALKLVIEGISSREAARQGKVSVAKVDSALDRAFRRGLLLKPASSFEGPGRPLRFLQEPKC